MNASPRPSKSTYRMASRAAATGAALCVLLASGVVLSQTMPQREIRFVSSIEAAPGMTESDVRLPTSPLDVRSAMTTAMSLRELALDDALEAIPETPWGRHGLANVPISASSISWNQARERYESRLDDGRVAVLTLDGSMQRNLETIMARYPEPGQAVVLLDPETGRVLAMADSTTNTDIPAGLARRSTAFAASIFKVITGAALIDGGFVRPQTENCYGGGSSGFDLSHLTPNPATDTACVTFTQAMARSANVVFARLADTHLTAERLQYWAERFAFNAMIPFEMDVDVSVAEMPLDRIEFARAAAGFRHTTMSALHGALINAAIANDGVMMAPTIVASIERGDEVVYRHEPTVWRRVMSSDTNRLVDATLTETCTSGTARRYFAQRSGWPGHVTVNGKTGTLSNRPAHNVAPEVYYLYSWFAGYGVANGRKVAASGLVVNTPTWHIRGSFLASEAILLALR